MEPAGRGGEQILREQLREGSVEVRGVKHRSAVERLPVHEDRAAQAQNGGIKDTLRGGHRRNCRVPPLKTPTPAIASMVAPRVQSSSASV